MLKKDIILKKINDRHLQHSYIKRRNIHMNERDQLRIYGKITPKEEKTINSNNTNIEQYVNINNINKLNNFIQFKNRLFKKNDYDCSIIISYKEGNDNRRLSLKRVLTFLGTIKNEINCEIILVEQDTHSKVTWLNEINSNENINHVFLKNDGVFNKGWGYNVGAKEAVSGKLIFHDADMFLLGKTYGICLKHLSNYDVVNPYNTLYSLDENDIRLFIENKYDFSVTNGKEEYYNSPISGGIFFILKNIYFNLKGFDEDCFGYGPEDRIFDVKIKTLNVNMLHLNEKTIHIHHEKNWTEDPYYHFLSRNKDLYEKYLNMNKVDLENKINNINIINNSKIKGLNEYFNNIYCINLDERVDKYNECLIEFDKLNVRVERVSAINGRNIFKPGLNISAGNYGLVLTNIKIIENAIANKYSNILILEDDVMFINDFYHYFNKKIDFLPNDWDMLYIGGNHQFNKGKFNLVTGDSEFVVNRDNYKLLNHELAKTTWTQTTHAVAINSKFFETALKFIKENSNIPIDMIYCKIQQSNYNIYTFLPSLALQRPSFSDIENVFVDYNKDCTF